MKKAAVFLLTVMLPVILAGCRPKAAVELPFTLSEVEAAEMFRYVVPADAEKKVITEPADIESLCAVFDGISVQEQALEPAAGSGAAGFRFCLSDGTLYEIVYCPVAVKSGSLYLSWSEQEYVTDADIGAVWRQYGYSAVHAEEGELPDAAF